MLQLLVFSMSALAEEPELPDCTGMEGDEKAACETAHEQAAQRAVIKAQLTELGECAALKKKKKVAACKDERNELELQLAALTPVEEEVTTDSRGLPAPEGAAPRGGRSLELDVGDE
ncbi:MAG: hypothetical protein KTR31_17785 [Myxococcales bacterium]|nr:hypothetical protein [Myxococcales bacterium]